MAGARNSPRSQQLVCSGTANACGCDLVIGCMSKVESNLYAPLHKTGNIGVALSQSKKFNKLV